MKPDRLNTADIEYALARRLGPRRYTICPNVSWGLDFHHELDLCVLTGADWVWEIEIKVSAHDLKRDADKAHGHKDDRIRALFFAIPRELERLAGNIPLHAGIWVVDNNLQCELLRKPVLNKGARKFTDAEKFKMVRLASMRLWDRKPRPLIGDVVGVAVNDLMRCGYDVYCIHGIGAIAMEIGVGRGGFGQVYRKSMTMVSRLQLQETAFPEQLILDTLKHTVADLDTTVNNLE